MRAAVRACQPDRSLYGKSDGKSLQRYGQGSGHSEWAPATWYLLTEGGGWGLRRLGRGALSRWEERGGLSPS